METITLKNSDLTVSRFCFGGCPLGGHGWGSVDDNEMLLTIESAVDQGINFFDTADTYGLGKSEKLLGKAIKNKRNQVVLATKVGVVVENGYTRIDNSPKWIQQALENSLKRLNTDYIDLYQIHYLTDNLPLDDIMNTLSNLQQKGLIRYIGLSNISKKDYFRLIPYKTNFVSFQVEYSLANREHEDDIRFLSKELDITPMTWGSLGQGILTGKYNEQTVFPENDRRSREIYKNFHGEKLKKNLALIEKMKEISQSIKQSLPAIAIRYILDTFPDSIVLAGMKNRTQLKSNLSSMQWELSAENRNILRSFT